MAQLPKGSLVRGQYTGVAPSTFHVVEMWCNFQIFEGEILQLIESTHTWVLKMVVCPIGDRKKYVVSSWIRHFSILSMLFLRFPKIIYYHGSQPQDQPKTLEATMARSKGGKVEESNWHFRLINFLGGGFKHVLFPPLPGKMIQCEALFFKWVETTN